MEEVGRHHGLNKIQPTIPASFGVGRLGAGQAEERVIRDILVGAGLTETITYAFVDRSGDTAADPVRLANPLADQQSVLRTSVVVPGLLEALETNVRQGRRDVALFELGRVFLPGEPLPREERRLAILLAGAARPVHWSEQAREVDSFDARGQLELVFERLGLGPLVLDPEGPRPDILHPGQSAAVVLGPERIGWLGTLRPGVREGKDPVVVAEIALDPVLRRATTVARFETLARQPAVERDLSVLADVGMAAGEIVAKVEAAAGELLRQAEVKDRYDRPPVPAGKVSLMLSLRYQDPSRTLTSEEVQASVEAVIRELRGAGLEIRGELKRGSTVEDSFKLLEERIRRAAERLKELQSENESLRARTSENRMPGPRRPRSSSRRSRRSEASRARAPRRRPRALARELKGLRKEREEIRTRLGRLSSCSRISSSRARELQRI